MSLAVGLAVARLLAVAGGVVAAGQTPYSPAEGCAIPPREGAGGTQAPRAPPPSDDEARRWITGLSKRADRASAQGWPDSVALALSLQAVLLNYLGRPELAMAPAHRALQSAPAGSESKLQALLAMGETWQYRGFSDSALPHYREALALTQVSARNRQRGRVCNDLGMAYHELGDVTLALAYLSQARGIRSAVGDDDGVATTLNNIGRVYTTIGRPTRALVFFDSALVLRRHLRDPVGEATALNNKGYAYDLLGLPSVALTMHQQALTALARVGSPSLRGLTLLNIGRAQLALGRPAEAVRSLTQGKKAKEEARDAAGVSWAYHDLGRASLALGRRQEGIAWLEKGRTHMRDRDPVREGSALYYLASAYEAAADSASLRRAVATYDTAARVRLRVGGRVREDADRVLFDEQDRNLTARWALTWMKLGQWLPRDSVASASLAAVEHGRARALFDLLRETTPAIETRPTGFADPAGAPSLSYLITQQALLTWLVQPSGAVRVYCQRVTKPWLDTLVTGLRNLLYAPTAATGVADSGATMLDETGVPLPAECTGQRPPAGRIVQQGLDSVLSALGVLLLPQALRSQLPASGELIIVPNGDLGLVPFAALPMDASGTPLGIGYGLRYAPSLAFLARVDRRRPSGEPQPSLATSVIVGDPAMPMDPESGRPFPALQLAGQTARWLADKVHARALTGLDATKARVVAVLPQAALVHFGTHGRAFGSEAEARSSFVVLAPDTADDGLLTVAEVADSLRLSAELVVLLACQTGLGDIKETEGTIGLQRAFLARGARSVLVSLWQVDTAATDMLIREFYEQWLDRRTGKAEALRLAQMKVSKEWTIGRSPGKRLNPYWWAGFQLVGAH